MKSLLLILVFLVAITAVFTGLVLASNPDGGFLNLPANLLRDTPFTDFRVPGILLAVLVGIPNLLAVFYNMDRHRQRYNWAMAGGVMLSLWTIAQLLMINTIYWLHFILLVAGLLIILIAYQLKGKWLA